MRITHRMRGEGAQRAGGVRGFRGFRGARPAGPARGFWAADQGALTSDRGFLPADRGLVTADRGFLPADRGLVTSDRGLSTIEVVILAPVIILFILVLVAFGQLVDGRGAVDGAARDAARAGSIQRSQSVAMDQATEAARADLDDTCVAGTLSVTQTSDGFAPDTLFSVQVSCTIRGLGSLGLDIKKTITSSASSPLDPYRRAVAN